MRVLKPLEWVGKVLLAMALAALSWRPFRASRAQRKLADWKRVLLVRLDHRVGEALLTTPLFDRLRAANPGCEVHVLVHPKMRRVLEGHPHVTKLWDFERQQLWLGALAPFLRAVRRERFDAVVNCGNWDAVSVTSAAVARLAGGAGCVVGPANFPSGWLMDVSVPAAPGEPSEAFQRAHLLAPLGAADAPARLSFRSPKPGDAVTAFASSLSGRVAVVNPGGRLGERRVPAEVFAAGARAMLERGVTPVVTWGPGEEAMADAVCAACPGAVRAPPTSIDELAFLMSKAALTLCNNTGPMHLAVAVGCPTLALFFRMPIDRWGHAYAPHHMLDVTPALDGGGDAPGLVAKAVEAMVSAPPAAVGSA